MSSKKEQKEASVFLDNLVEFYSGFDELSSDELKEELREEGIDPEALLVRAQMLITSKIKTANKLAWKDEVSKKRKILLDKFSTIKVEISENMLELKKRISDFFSGRLGSDVQSHATAFFRNLEEITDEDLKSLYEEFMKLQALNEAGDKNKNE